MKALQITTIDYLDGLKPVQILRELVVSSAVEAIELAYSQKYSHKCLNATVLVETVVQTKTRFYYRMI